MEEELALDEAAPVVRIEEAGLGADAQVRLVVSRVSDPAALRSRWSSSGAVVEQLGGRLHATTTVEALARAAGRSLPTDEAQRLDETLRAAVRSWLSPAPPVGVAGHPLAPVGVEDRPLVMGVVNVTPDSFSDGGSLYPDGHPDRAIEHALRLVEEGADLIDVGGESTRPGAEPVRADEELARVIPVVEALHSHGVLVSIDTVKASVATSALEAGAGIVNDVSGARDPALVKLAAESGAAYVLMHARGTPADMRQRTGYDDVVAEVYEFFADGLHRCAAIGLGPGRVLVDPGIGFAKEAEHNLALLRHLRQFRGLGCPVLVGASRKSFLGKVLGGVPIEERLEGSLAAAAMAVAAGASVVRVHDVAETVRVVRTVHAIATGLDLWTPS